MVFVYLKSWCYTSFHLKFEVFNYRAIDHATAHSEYNQPVKYKVPPRINLPVMERGDAQPWAELYSGIKQNTIHKKNALDLNDWG